ncbi:MAG: hypothetical protein EBU90_28410 [Proteobacteria bacterium]|nr:hypothetical protein [Pseudomonadota bacterium]
MAKDETVPGLTGKPVPKPTTARKQYELEKRRRERRHLGRNVGGTQYSSDVNPYFNPRSVREEVLSYLLDEGFASDEKSAEAIMGAMSEAWIESIVEEVLDEATIRSVTSPQGKIRYKSPKYSPDEIKNIYKTAHRQHRLRQRRHAGESEERSGQRWAEWEHQQDELRRKHPSRAMNAKIDSEGEPYYKEVPTDWHARKRRASAR